MTEEPKTISLQESARPPVPPRDTGPGAHHRRWIFAPLVLLAIVVIGMGNVAGIILYVATHSRAFTGSTFAPRPTGDVRPFGWPLRLTRRVNILLIGVDVTINERKQVLPYSRSDALALVSFDPQRDRIGVLSIPRDTWMTVPQIGEERINAAYAVGGPRLTIRTVQELLGVPVQYYVKLGPASFAKIVDAIGGIEMDVEKDMKYTDTWGDLYIDLKKGRQLLSGDGAAQYIRFRNDDEGDIGRIRRQHKLLLAIIQKLKSPAMTLALPRVVHALVNNAQTNLSLSELITLGLFTARLDLARIQTVTLPGEVGNFVFLDEDQMQQIVAEMFLGVNRQTLESAGVEVLNGSGIPGLARQLAQRLERLGFRVVRVARAAQPAQTTTIIDRTGRTHVVQALAELLGRKPVTHESGSGADITIVVARDMAAWYPPEVSQH